MYAAPDRIMAVTMPQMERMFFRNTSTKRMQTNRDPENRLLTSKENHVLPAGNLKSFLSRLTNVPGGGKVCV